MKAIELRRLTGTSQDLADLQRVFESAPEYARRVSGSAPHEGAAQAALSQVPPGMSSEAKFVFGIFADGAMVGCADVLRGYPDAHTAFVGLLLMSEAWEGRGIGRRAYELLEGVCAEWPGIRVRRLAVLESNQVVMPFWEKVGFQRTGETVPHPSGSTAVLFEKALSSQDRDDAS